MIRDLLLGTPWPGILVWSALYVSDWRLTMTCARLYRNRVADTITLEGSYEITPFYQQEVDGLHGWSWKGSVVLAVAGITLWLLWGTSNGSWPPVYEIALGSLVSIQLVVHIRHLRNLYLFRSIGRPGFAGRLRYPRDVLLLASSYEILSFAVMFAVIFAVTGSWFVLGGIISCLIVSAQHWTLARRHLAAADPSPLRPA
jgi:hypothetical protein